MRAALFRHAGAGRLADMVLLDCTCGNGHDCLFLCQNLTGLPGGDKALVLALDIQQTALDAAAARCRACPPEPLFARCGHEYLEEALELYAPRRVLGLAVYNLGFLPGSDKTIVTRPESTLASLQQAARLMPPGALLCVHAYAGHPGGEQECRAVRRWCEELPPLVWRAAEYSLRNKKRNPESLFLAWKIENATM